MIKITTTSPLLLRRSLTIVMEQRILCTWIDSSLKALRPIFLNSAVWSLSYIARLWTRQKRKFAQWKEEGYYLVRSSKVTRMKDF